MMPSIVAVALILAIDVSASIDEREYELQKNATADAFRSAAVIEAITHTSEGCIGALVLEWSGSQHQQVTVPWVSICSERDAKRLAEAIRGTTRTSRDNTAIGAAIDFSAEQFKTMPFEAVRLVIDISSDGFNNEGGSVELARDAAEARGITINALTVKDDFDGIEAYFRQSVVTTGGFVMEATFETFPTAIEAKIVMEVS